MRDPRLDFAILDSIWERILWDFLEQNPQLEEWLKGSKLRETPDPDVLNVIVISPATVDWLGSHTFAIRRSLSQELKRPVEVRVLCETGPAVGVTE